MDRAQIDRWTGRRRLALAGVCVARATFMSAPATAAQNQPVDDLRRLPIAHVSTVPAAIRCQADSFTLAARSGSEPALP